MEVSRGSGVCAVLCIRRTLCIRDDLYINGHFMLFDCLLAVFDDSYTVPIVKNTQNHWCTNYQSSQVYQDCTNSVPTVYQTSKTVKRQSKQLKWGVKVKGLRDFNGLMGWVVKVKSKDSQNSKDDHWCTNRHMSTKTVPTVYQLNNVPIVKNSQNNKNEGLRLRG